MGLITTLQPGDIPAAFVYPYAKEGMKELGLNLDESWNIFRVLVSILEHGRSTGAWSPFQPKDLKWGQEPKKNRTAIGPIFKNLAPSLIEAGLIEMNAGSYRATEKLVLFFEWASIG